MSTDFDESTCYAVIAAMAPRPVTSVDAGARLRDDLLFDSMRLIELAMALERHFGLPTLDLGESVDVTTAGDIVGLIRRQLAAGYLAAGDPTIGGKA